MAAQAHGQVGHRVGQAGKFAELIMLGLIVGLCSIGLSFLWNRYAFLASDTAQHLAADLHPPTMPAPVVLIDIGERSCLEWAKQNHGGICGLLPRLSHGRLAAVFKKLEQAKPKLVVVDIDLQSDAPTAATGPDPFSWPASVTPDEESIRRSVVRMASTPFLVAQPLIKVPDGSQGYQYYAARTILHSLTKPNLFFGHINQSIDFDGVIRRFQATLPVRNPGQNSPDRVPHLALKACEALPEPELCGREPASTHGPPAKLMFGSHVLDPEEFVQFRYVLTRDVSRLFAQKVTSLEAIDVERAADVAAFDGAIVFVGSTALGRGDYHVTPLNAASAETAGVVIVMNEVLAALLDKKLASPSFLMVSVEKLFFIFFSAGLIFLLFWKPYIARYGARGFFDFGWGLRARIVLWFVFVAFLLLLINAIAILLISFYSLRHGEIADPITPVVAAIFDVVVDVCAIIGHKVAGWGDEYWARFREWRHANTGKPSGIGS